MNCFESRGESISVDGSADGGIVRVYNEGDIFHGVMHAGIDSGCVSMSRIKGSASNLSLKMGARLLRMTRTAKSAFWIM